MRCSGMKQWTPDNSITRHEQLTTGDSSTCGIHTANALETHGNDVNTKISVRMPRATIIIETMMNLAYEHMVYTISLQYLSNHNNYICV